MFVTWTIWPGGLMTACPGTRTCSDSRFE